MGYTFERALQAIAKAEALCQAVGRRLNLYEFNATSSTTKDLVRTDSRQLIKLQSLRIQPTSRATLQAVFSRLTSIVIDINDFSKPDEIETDANEIADALRLLLSSPGLKELMLELIDDGDTVCEDLSNANLPDHTWIGDGILRRVNDIECSDGLRRLDLAVNAIVESKEAVQKLIQKHASTLEEINIYALVAEPRAMPVDTSDARDKFTSLLRTIAGCPQLNEFTLFIGRGDLLTANVNVSGKEAVAARLEKMIMSPTETEDDHLWIDKEKQEEHQG